MDSVLRPPPPFHFENDVASVTSGNLSKEWEKWKKSYKIYMIACDYTEKTDEVKLNILLHIVGEKCREVYEQFTAGQEIKTAEQLLKKFDEYFLPKTNLTVERHKFFTRDQGDLESIEQYVFVLNKMASTCEFGTLSSGLVCDRLICGMKNDALRERLLREQDLTLTKAVDICRLAEFSRAQAVKIKTETTDYRIHELNSEKPKVEDQEVYWVGRRKGRTPAYARGGSRGDRGGRGGASGGAGRSRARGVHSSYISQFASGRQNKETSSHSRASPRSFHSEFSGCWKCGKVHKRYECPAYGQQCKKCNRMNHYARMCTVYTVQEESSDQVTHSSNSLCSEWVVDLKIKNQVISFKLDTGADVNVLPRKYLPKVNIEEKELTHTSLKLRGYSGSEIHVIGKCYLKVEHKKNEYIVKFVIADVDSPPILGRTSCEELNVIKRVMAISENRKNASILDDYSDVFVGMGCLPGEYKIQINENVKPVVHAPRKMPVAIRDQIKNTLKEMESQGIIAKVEGPTEWVSSMTVVKKPNGDLRICLDPRDLNKAIRREHFKLPTFEEMVANLSGAKYFSTLDAKQSFWQVKISEDCTDLLTFNTAFGRYKFLRMPFGISSASEIFHKKLYEHFDDMKGTLLFIDDLLVYGSTKKEHDDRLRAVMKRCQEINIKLNKAKCKIGLTEISYLGHKISQKGIFPEETHIKAIKNMPTPKNSKDVERFLGLVTYVGNFIPNLSEKTKILRELLKKDIEWHWDVTHDKCFENIKNCLASPPVLQYYSMKKPVLISVDASKNGLGACLLQDNLPVCYASKSLTKTEQSYAQIEKELYACVFACERFYTYIYGRTDVTIETDHKPLVSIINKPLSSAPARLQRMLLRLQPFVFTLVYKPGKYLFIADTLSRAVAPDSHTPTQPRDHLDAQAQVCAVASSNQLTDSHLLQIQKCTSDDDELQKLIKVVKRGWPKEKNKLDNELKPYWDCRDELTVDFGIVWKGCKIVIPKSMRQEMIRNIHIGHLGIEKCKLRARQIMYWPNMTSQLQDFLSHCQACLTHRKLNTKEPLMQHDIPDRAWSKVGVDIFHFGDKSYVLTIDYYSKFIEVAKLKSLKSYELIKQLKRTFTRHGIPEKVMTDNGPEFSSNLFDNFAREWKFEHMTSSPRYPQSNGQVERAIQTIKNMMKKTAYDRSDFQLALLEYLNTPISAEIASPAELLYNRKLRSIVPCSPQFMKPYIQQDVKSNLRKRQYSQKYYYDKGSRNLASLKVNQKVKIRLNNKWMPGTIEGIIDPRSYLIRSNEGNIIRRNRKHIIKDSEKRDDSTCQYSSQYDDIKLQTSVSSSSPVQQNTYSNHYHTRSGRTVRLPDRWGFPTPEHHTTVT